MPFDLHQWRARISGRSDITGMVTHLTKPSEDSSGTNEKEWNKLATENLISILGDGKIRGSTTKKGFIVGNTKAVCFQDAPLYGITQNVEREREQRKKDASRGHRYFGVGLSFSKWYTFERGGRPVVYEQTEIAKQMLPKSEHWRIVSFKIIKEQPIVDWTHEREWRVPGDFSFDPGAAHVLLYNKTCWDHFAQRCPSDLFKQIHGITVLKSITM